VTLAEFGLFLCAVLASVVGQLFLKTGALRLGKVDASNWLDRILGIATTPELLAGLCFYGMGAIAYILVLTRVNLSVAAPAVALSYVFAFPVGYFLFKESIPISRFVGLALIICGVILVVSKK